MVADGAFKRYAGHWKPRTRKVSIFVWFRGRWIGDITAHDAQRWFAMLRSTPAAAERIGVEALLTAEKTAQRESEDG